MSRFNRAGVESICGSTFSGAPEKLEAAFAAPGSYLALLDPRGHAAQTSFGAQVVQFYLAEKGYRAGLTKAEIQSTMSSRGSNAHLAAVFAEKGLSRYVDLPNGYQGGMQPATASSGFCAMIGAAYESGGMAEVARVMESLGE